MDRLSAFGVFAVSTMLIFYALEPRSCWFILAFAGSCMLASTDGFLTGAWPFGTVEGIWSLVAVRRWWRTPLFKLTHSAEAPVKKHVARAIVEIGFIVFLFYANLLMGEFERSGQGSQRGIEWALGDIFTLFNFAIALIAAFIGYGLVEFLRKRL